VAWPQPLPGVPLQLFGAADQRLVVADPPSLINRPRRSTAHRSPLPAGSDVAATRWGDLVAIAPIGSGLMTAGRREAGSVPLADHPSASPPRRSRRQGASGGG